MDGVFDFDAAGIAAALSAPDWSRKALEQVSQQLEDAARAYSSADYSDGRASSLLLSKLDVLESEMGEQSASLRDLTSEIRKLNASKSRTKIAASLLGVAAILGWVADAGGAVQVTSDLVTWVIQQYEEGNAPEPSEWRPPVAPHGSPQ